jgi:transcriptional regulator with XRE-family HTH domain
MGSIGMNETVGGWEMASARVEVLRILLIERRKQAGLTQGQLAEKLGTGWHQSTVAAVESGQRKIDVLEFVKIAEACSFDGCELLKTLATVKDE